MIAGQHAMQIQWKYHNVLAMVCLQWNSWGGLESMKHTENCI